MKENRKKHNKNSIRDLSHTYFFIYLSCTVVGMEEKKEIYSANELKKE